MQQLNFQFFQKFWRVGKLYWFGEEKWGAIGLLLTLIAIVLFSTHVNVIANTQQGEVLSALAAKDGSRFWTTTRNLFGSYFILLVIWASYNYPKLEEILFLPQRPYMVLGTLRDQLIYPNPNLNITNQELYQVLQKVNLPSLADRFGGFDVEKDWADVLSLGEQQRIAFARILITKPKYVILDEATSALDVHNEEHLYQHLLNAHTTFISVGHRPTLLSYHNLVLELLDNDKWELKSVKNLFYNNV